MTVSDTVIDQIMDLIRTGQLKAGERLPSEHGLVELLGVGLDALALSSVGSVSREK